MQCQSSESLWFEFDQLYAGWIAEKVKNKQRQQFPCIDSASQKAKNALGSTWIIRIWSYVNTTLLLFRYPITYALSNVWLQALHVDDLMCQPGKLMSSTHTSQRRHRTKSFNHIFLNSVLSWCRAVICLLYWLDSKIIECGDNAR